MNRGEQTFVRQIYGTFILNSLTILIPILEKQNSTQTNAILPFLNKQHSTHSDIEGRMNRRHSVQSKNVYLLQCRSQKTKTTAPVK